MEQSVIKANMKKDILETVDIIKEVLAGCFDNIFRSIRFLVKFWRPLARIGAQNSTLQKLSPPTYFAYN